MKQKTDQAKQLQKLEEEKLVLTTEYECLKRELTEKSNDLNNERTKLDTTIRTEQSLKLKNEALLESIDKLTVECENLNKRLATADDSKLKFEHKQLIDAYKSKEAENENLKYDTELLQNSVNSLQRDLKKMKENEILMIRYPDLYGPLEQLNENEMNVCDDMINQINANKYRINLLESLNKKLNNSIKKLNETQMNETGIMNQTEQNDTSLNYFMKPPQSTSRTTPANSTLATPRNNSSSSSNRQALTRPVPLFKLENEINEAQLNEKIPPPSSAHSNIENKASERKFWNQNESLAKEANNTLLNDESTLSSDTEEDDLNFLKDKRESDKSYLDKLNQISQISELKIENSDFSMLKNRRNISSRGSPFLYSPSPSQLLMNSEARSANQSRVSNYSANRNTSRPNSRVPVVPPAEKNMEVIVGKGRSSSRPNSAAKTQNNSSSTPKSGAPKSAKDKDSSNEYKCENCEKCYNNIKDFDIHKLYCNKK